jgi:hypothetical protein
VLNKEVFKFGLLARRPQIAVTRGRFIGYEYDRMVVLFSMLDGDREVACAISTSTMDELEGVVRARAGQREAQFMRLRERIEACAAGKYPATGFEGAPPGSFCAASISGNRDSSFPLCTLLDIRSALFGCRLSAITALSLASVGD